MRHAVRLSWLLPAVLAFACGTTEPSVPPSETQAQLTAAKRLWRSHGISHYTYVFSRGCFCVFEYSEPVTITVRGDQIVSVVSVATGQPKILAGYQTVDGLFDIIQKAIDGGAPLVQAEYDPSHGYPRSVYIDLDQRLADEEISFEAGGLKPIQ